MATKKTSKTTETRSKFYIVKTANEAKKKIESKLKTYNEKYVKQQLENGREFITELKSDPVKRIDDLIDDSKDALKKARTAQVKSLQKRVSTTKKDVRKKIKKMTRTSRGVYSGIENDAKLIVEDFIALGKKNMDKIPMKKTIEKKISDGIDAIPTKLNLPTKFEIDNLVTGLDGVNKKVAALNKQFKSA